MLEVTKKLCKEFGILPTKTKGQNFLIREDVFDEIVETANLSKKDTVLEVGPGLGFMTEKLARMAGKVVAVELDDKLASALKYRLKGLKNLSVFNENVLDFEVEKWGLDVDDWKVVANLPYNITSIFLRKILALEKRPKSLVLMLQKEVAERIVAKPGKMSLLAVSVQRYAKVRIVEQVPKEYFWPKPEVDSAVILIETTKNDKNKKNEKDFFRLAKIGFSQKRKMLKNNLSNGYHIPQKEAEEWILRAGFNAKVRAQELSVGDWEKLLACLEI